MSYYFAPGVQLNAPPAVAGDLIVGRADGLFNRLAIGANGSFLNVSAGAMRWGNTIDTGGLTVTAGGISVSAGGIVVAGTLGLRVTSTAPLAGPAGAEMYFDGFNANFVGFNRNAGTYQPIQIIGSTFTVNIAGATPWQILGAGHLLTGTDNTYDIGGSINNRPRDVHVARSVIWGGDIGAGVAANITVTNVTGIGTGVQTALTAPAIGAGGGPTGVAVTDWMKVYDGVTVSWIPMFT